MGSGGRESVDQHCSDIEARDILTGFGKERPPLLRSESESDSAYRRESREGMAPSP